MREDHRIRDRHDEEARDGGRRAGGDGHRKAGGGGGRICRRPVSRARVVLQHRVGRLADAAADGSGSRLAFVARFLGRRIEYVYEIVELVPGARLVMQTDGKPFPMRTTYEWETADGGATRMVLRNNGKPSGFATIGARPMAAAMRSAMTKDLARIRTILESR